MRFLLDTSALSEIVRPAPDAGFLRWLQERDETTLFVSVITLGELHKGVAHLADGRRKTRLRQWIDEDIAERFEERLLGVDLEIAISWGRLQGKALAAGEPLPVVDSLLAATALVHRLTIVTRNGRDFERCGAELHSPWSA